MAQALQRHVGDVVYLGPDNSKATERTSKVIWKLNGLIRKFGAPDLVSDHNRILSKRLGSFFREQMRGQKIDILFAPAASIEIAYLESDVPLVYFSDITWNDIIDYYPEYSGFRPIARREGENIEARAIRQAKAVVYPSAWPGKSAHEHYHAHEEDIFEIPFGANLQEPPSREAALAHRLGPELELLWVGVDWNRKGGATAFECFRELLDSGVNVRLTSCGCIPPKEFEHPKFRVIPFLNKHDPEQRRQLSELFLGAHFFLFPTRADATPLVIAEASAHGLPCLTTATGGIGGHLKEGKNGYMLPPGADGRAYASKIMSLLQEPEAYRALVRESRELFETRLNWDAWGNSMREVFSFVLGKEKAR